MKIAAKSMKCRELEEKGLQQKVKNHWMTKAKDGTRTLHPKKTLNGWMIDLSLKFIFHIIIWPCLKRIGNDQIQELDSLKLILTTV